MIKMQSNANKMSNIVSFPFFKTARQFAHDLTASCHHTNIWKVTIRIWSTLQYFTFLSLFSFYLSIRNVKRRKGFISSSWKGHIIYYETPLRLQLQPFCSKNKLEEFCSKQSTAKNYWTVSFLEMPIVSKDVDVHESYKTDSSYECIASMNTTSNNIKDILRSKSPNLDPFRSTIKWYILVEIEKLKIWNYIIR